jgi:hypothetical protein
MMVQLWDQFSQFRSFDSAAQPGESALEKAARGTAAPSLGAATNHLLATAAATAANGHRHSCHQPFKGTSHTHYRTE